MSRRRMVSTVLAAAIWWSACSPQAQPPVAFIAGESAALDGFLARLETLSGTPAAELAAAARARLRPCRSFVAEAPRADVGALVDALRCQDGESSRDVATDRERGSSDLIWGFPIASGAVATGRVDFGSDGSATLTMTLPEPPQDVAWSILLPAAEPPGAARLSASEAIVAGRFRADRALDFARLISTGQELDRLYKLKSRLFSSAVLAGTWELALYMPRESSQMPRMAVALDLKHRGPAVAAMEEFLDQIESQWNLRRSPFREGELGGACFRDLLLLPELAPCYVFRDKALIVGWNADSVDHARQGEGDPLLAEGSRLLVRLHLFDEAEEVMTRALESDRGRQAEEASTPQVYPWSTLSISGRREGGEYQFTAELR